MIKSFKVLRLFGCKDMQIDFKEGQTIVLGANGVGKTTVLNILNDILQKNFSRLEKYSFESAEIFTENEKTIKIEKSKIFQLNQDADSRYKNKEFKDKTLKKAAKKNGRIIPLYQDILEQYKLFGEDSIETSDSIKALASMIAGVNTKELKHIIKQERINSIPYVKQVEQKINLLMKDIDVIFMPTFRKIEAEEKDIENIKHYSFSGTPNQSEPQIAFAMKDIEHLINEQSNILMNIFHDKIITKELEPQDKSSEDEEDEYNVFKKLIEDGSKIYRQLVDVLNRYLNDKKFIIHSFSNIRLINTRDSEKMSLNKLSSGEKQLVSILFKVYLSKKPIFLIIDEPEISLGIGWQRTIIGDLKKAPKCEYILASTHSPYILGEDDEISEYHFGHKYSPLTCINDYDIQKKKKTKITN